MLSLSLFFRGGPPLLLVSHPYTPAPPFHRPMRTHKPIPYAPLHRLPPRPPYRRRCAARWQPHHACSSPALLGSSRSSSRGCRRAIHPAAVAAAAAAVAPSQSACRGGDRHQAVQQAAQQARSMRCSTAAARSLDPTRRRHPVLLQPSTIGIQDPAHHALLQPSIPAGALP